MDIPRSFTKPYWRGRHGVWYQHAPDLKICGRDDAHLSGFRCDEENKRLFDAHRNCPLAWHVYLIENDSDAQWITNHGFFYQRVEPMLNVMLELKFQKSFKLKNVFRTHDIANEIIGEGKYGVEQ